MASEAVYRPGSWLGIYRDGTALVLSQYTAPVVLRKLWELLGGHAPWQRIEAELAAAGDCGVWHGGQSRVRGNVRVDTGAAVPGNGGCRLFTADGSPAGREWLPLGEGVVLLAELLIPGELGGSEATEAESGSTADFPSGDSESTRFPAAAPGQLNPQEVSVTFSTGEVHALREPLLIGRDPSPVPGFPAECRLLTVDSPAGDISRTHAGLRAEGTTVLLTDLHATNGTVLLRPGAGPRRLAPGEEIPVLCADVIRLGEGLTMTVQEQP